MMAEPFTPRESDVAALLAYGMTNKQIGARLGISLGVVKLHVGAILRKLAVANRTQAALALRAR